MLKKVLKKLGKVLLVVFILLSIVAAVGFGIGFYAKTREINQINALYDEVQSNLNKSKEESELTISDLKESFAQLNKQIELLRKENKELAEKAEQLSSSGYGFISGTIATVVSSDTAFTQYQLVCAENTANKSLQYCISASAIEQKYSLAVPNGSYTITSRIITKDGNLSSARAGYTEFVKCAKEKGASQCDSALSAKLATVEIKAGASLKDINPVDWSF